MRSTLAFARARTHTHRHIVEHARVAAADADTRRYYYERDSQPCTHSHTHTRLIIVRLHRVSVSWHMGQTASKRVKRKKDRRKKKRGSIEELPQRASLIAARTTKRVCLVCCGESRRYRSRCGRSFVDTFRSTKGRCKDSSFRALRC